VHVTIVCSADGNQLGWTCPYCLDPPEIAWLSAGAPDVLDALDRMDRVHFANVHTPVALKDAVLLSKEIDPALIRQAVYDVAVKATEREQQWAKQVLGIATEEAADHG
jgi:hypothetical protein